MKKDFYTEQELMTMPLAVVRGLDFETKEQEQLVQRVIDRRFQNLPPSQPIYRRDVPDIETPEQEAEWQATIDARAAKLKPKMEEIPLETPPSEVTLSPEAKAKRTVNRKK